MRSSPHSQPCALHFARTQGGKGSTKQKAPRIGSKKRAAAVVAEESELTLAATGKLGKKAGASSKKAAAPAKKEKSLPDFEPLVSATAHTDYSD